MLIVEATAVTPEGRITANDLGLYSDEAEEALTRIISSVKQHTQTPIAIQLGHAGRKASSHTPWNGGKLVPKSEGGWHPLAPSALSHAEGEEPPHAMSLEDMERTKEAFVNAGKRAVRCGVNAIELHVAHGYLLHEFLSPLSNQRQDTYGGSLENRMRYPLEVFAALRASLPENIPLGVRISATDWVTGGWDTSQSIAFSKKIEHAGAAYLHVSSGGLTPKQEIPLSAGYQVAFAAEIRRHVSLPIITVGLITEAEQAETIITSGQADMVAIGRAILYNPRWPWHAAAKLGAEIDVPKPYWRCHPHGLKNTFKLAQTSQR